MRGTKMSGDEKQPKNLENWRFYLQARSSEVKFEKFSARQWLDDNFDHLIKMLACHGFLSLELKALIKLVDTALDAFRSRRKWNLTNDSKHAELLKE
jgi:hypothetical protein